MKYKFLILLSILFFLKPFLEASSLTITMQDHFDNRSYKKSVTSFKDKIKKIVIFCPFYVSGGPENLCQIYASLKKEDFEVYMFWLEKDYSKISKKYKNGSWYLSPCESHLIPKVYQENYNVNYLDHELKLDEHTLIIVPEIWCDFINFFEESFKMIAWLSIDNLYLLGKSEICRELIHEKRLGDLDCIHAAQAPWIQKKLHDWGANSILLEDYISNNYFISKVNEKIDNSIAFYPKKCSEISSFFIELYPSFNYIRLENLDQLGMISALDSAKIYIDFGFFPGKDRIPREALLRNCVIFIRNVGCATDYDSFPIDDYFRFSEEDINDGTLYKKVQEVLMDYENMQIKQSFMRNQVLKEKETFNQRIQEYFGIPLK